MVSILILISAAVVAGPAVSQPLNLSIRPERGYYFAPAALTMRCETPGATIIYTLDGTEPSPSNGTSVASIDAEPRVLASLLLTNTTILRAAAFKDGFAHSKIATHTYIFPAFVAQQKQPAAAQAMWIEDPPDGDGRSYPAKFEINPAVVSNTIPGYSFTNALLSIPTLSIVTPMEGLFGPSGIYTRPMKRGAGWERAASMEFIYSDGRASFQADAGARIHGAVSRLNHATPKHPLRLSFRAEYGLSKLDYAIFPDSKVRRFEHLVLRACSTDAWPMANTVDFLWRNQDATYQRDQWMRDTQLAMGQPSPHGIYVQLYLNGLYWGLYNLTERPGAAFAATHSGGKKSEYDVVGEYNELRAGSREVWDQLLAMADRVPRAPEVYWQIIGLNADGSRNPKLPVLLDVDNLIDYMALHIYAPAVDWPNRNWWAARRRGAESRGFQFYVWDQEVALDRLERTTTWGNNRKFAEVNERGTPAQIYDRLRQHPEFKRRFAARLAKHLAQGGALSLNAAEARWSKRAAEIDHAIVGESARWGAIWQEQAYTREGDWLRMSNFTQNVYFPNNFGKAVERFRSVGLIEGQ